MATVQEASADIKKLKGEYWSRPGAATVYEKGVSSPSGFIQIKNRVEREIVLRSVRGRILDAGTGTGRFAIPLAAAGNSVVALDYSREMLDLNRRLAAEQGVTGIEYHQGDVEHLPFESGSFDAVVSITVVRHFPQWQNILREYVRVLKPGGRLVFEMCSGDHLRAANRISPRFGSAYSRDGFFDFEVEVPFEELKGFLDGVGIEIEERLTYDFLNNNCFLKLASVTNLGYRIVLKGIKTALCLPPLQRLGAWLELNLLRNLPPVCSYNYMIVGRKR